MTFKLLVITVLFLNLSASGCNVLNHLDELSTLGEFSRDKNSQHTLVDKTNENYHKLIDVIKSGKIKDYSDKTSILHNFLEPAAVRSFNENGEVQEEWLYREAIPQNAKDKIYLYFDSKGKLLNYKEEQIQW